MIKYTLKKVIEMQDWDRLVKETYGKPYRFQQQDGCQPRGTVEITIPEGNDEEYDYDNDSVPEVINGDKMGVSFKAWLARDPKEWKGKKEDRSFLDLFWGRNFYPALQVVANDLHRKGLIEAGEYTINIDW
jgi:hypothetical protein